MGERGRDGRGEGDGGRREGEEEMEEEGRDGRGGKDGGRDEERRGGG